MRTARLFGLQVFIAVTLLGSLITGVKALPTKARTDIPEQYQLSTNHFEWQYLRTRTGSAATTKALDRPFSLVMSGSVVVTGNQQYMVVTTGTTQPRNVSLTIQNVGNTTIRRPLVTLLGHDWSTVDGLLADATKPDMTAEEKAWAIWQFARTNLYQFYPVSEYDLSVYDPVVLYNGYGYAFCNGIAASVAALLERAGIPARLWNPQGGGLYHIVPEAFYDGAWHMFDANLDVVYMREDNRTVAGVEDLINNPQLVARLGPGYDRLTEMYAETPPTAHFPGSITYRIGHDMSWLMRPQESLTLFWEKAEGYHDDMITPLYPEVPPPVFTNGILVSQFNFADPLTLSFVESVSGAQVAATAGTPALQPITTSTPARLVVRIQSPYPIISTTVQLDSFQQVTDQVQVYVSHQLTSAYWSSLDLHNARYRTKPWYVDEDNLQPGIDGVPLPSLHAAEPGQPAHLTYRFRRLPDATQPLILAASLHRATSADVVSLAVSNNNVDWQTVWTAEQTGYFNPLIDLSSQVTNGEDFYLRINLYTAPGQNNLHPGIQWLSVEGIDPFVGEPAWESASRSVDGVQSIELTPVIADPMRAAPYTYYIALVLNSESDTTMVGVRSLVLTTTVQMSPASLPTLRLGENQLIFRSDNGEPVAVQITHAWNSFEGTHPPPAPEPLLAAPTSIRASYPFTLAWAQANDHDGDAIVKYHVQLCLRPDCRWPVNSYYDVDTGRSDSNWPVFRPELLSVDTTYYWRVKAQDATGLWSDYSHTSAFRVVDEVPLSGLSVLLQPSQTSVGQTIQLTASVVGNNPVFSWDMGDGTTYTGQAVSHAYTTPGNYLVHLTAANTVSQLSMSNPVTIEVPLSGLSVLLQPSQTSVGQTIQLTASVAGSNPVFSWDMGDGTTYTGQAVSHAYTTPGNYLVHLTAANIVSQLSMSNPVTITSQAHTVWLPAVLK